MTQLYQSVPKWGSETCKVVRLGHYHLFYSGVSVSYISLLVHVYPARHRVTIIKHRVRSQSIGNQLPKATNFQWKLATLCRKLIKVSHAMWTHKMSVSKWTAALYWMIVSTLTPRCQSSKTGVTVAAQFPSTPTTKGRSPKTTRSPAGFVIYSFKASIKLDTRKRTE